MAEDAVSQDPEVAFQEIVLLELEPLDPHDLIRFEDEGGPAPLEMD